MYTIASDVMKEFEIFLKKDSYLTLFKIAFRLNHAFSSRDETGSSIKTL